MLEGILEFVRGVGVICYGLCCYRFAFRPTSDYLEDFMVSLGAPKPHSPSLSRAVANNLSLSGREDILATVLVTLSASGSGRSTAFQADPNPEQAIFKRASVQSASEHMRPLLANGALHVTLNGLRFLPYSFLYDRHHRGQGGQGSVALTLRWDQIRKVGLMEQLQGTSELVRARWVEVRDEQKLRGYKSDARLHVAVVVVFAAHLHNPPGLFGPCQACLRWLPNCITRSECLHNNFSQNECLQRWCLEGLNNPLETLQTLRTLLYLHVNHLREQCSGKMGSMARALLPAECGSASCYS